MIREYHLKGTDFKYIIVQQSIVFSNNVTFTIAEFKRYFEQGELAKKIEQFVTHYTRLNDYFLAMETGELHPVHLPVMRKKRIRKVIAKPVESPLTNPVMLIALGFFALGASIISIYHMTQFWLEGGKPIIVSVLIAFLLVLFAAASFSISERLKKDKKILAIFINSLATIIVVFIAFCTCSVNYTQFHNSEADTVDVARKEISYLELYEDIKKQIDESNRFTAKLQMQIKWKKDKDIQKEKDILQKERAKLSVLQAKAIELKEKAGGGTVVQKEASAKGSFLFLSEFMGVKETTLRMIAYSSAAVFFDLISPISWAAFTVFWRRRKYDRQ